MVSKKILALSSSRSGNNGFLEKAVDIIGKFLGSKATNIAFIPFASVAYDYEEYGSAVREALKDLPIEINVATVENAKTVIESCDAIVTGGGNTFKLIHEIYELNLLNLIRDKIDKGTIYIGWSAGSNILCPTLGTTNDMPIIQPKSFNALGVFPFQINPHYFNYNAEGFNGETRDQRIEEFLKINPGISVVGLPEGCRLEMQNDVVTYFGEDEGALFQQKEEEFERKKIMPGEDLSFLL